MVLKRQLPSRVAPDEALASSAQGAAASPATDIDTQWPAPPKETPVPTQTAAPAAFSAPALTPGNEFPSLPPLPPLENIPAAMPVAVEQSAPPQPEIQTAPVEPVDTTPSMPSSDMSRRRVKAPRAFTEEALATPPATPGDPAVAPVPVPTNTIAEAPTRLADAGLIESKVDPLTVNQPAAVPAMAAASSIFETPSSGAGGIQPSIVAAPVPSMSLPEPTSDLPWASESKTTKPESSGWDIDTPTSESPANTPISASPSVPMSPPPDLFRDVSANRSSEGPMPTLPWSAGSMGGGNGNRPPPELPKNSISSTPRGGSFQVVLAAAAVAGVVFLAYYMVSGSSNGRAQEQLARLTGSLREAPEVVPGSPSSTNPSVQPNLQPEKVIAMNTLSGTALPGGVLPPPTVMASANQNNTFAPMEPARAPGTSPSTVVDFADVPPADASKPIVADGSEKMPDDVGFIANLQSAIAKEKAKDAGQPAAIKEAEAAKTADKNLTPEQKLQRGADLKAQLDDELAAYRKALADAPAPALAPKPTEFFSQPKQFMNGKNELAAANSASNTLLPPPAKGAAGSKTAAGNVEGLPPAELYANNPKNLPILPEPAAEAPPKVRQLADFDVNVFAPEEPKVRMPRGIKPSLAAGNFPALDILSLVPGRGLIAYYEGKEGVLMLGEQVAGWKLVGVNNGTAEFASGEKHQVVRPD